MIIQGVTVRGTSVYDASFNPQGLVVYLDANNSSSYPGTGTTLNDLSGNGYTLPLNTWTQVVYVWKAGATKTLETFINGASIGVVTHTLSSLLNVSNPLYLGSYNGGEYSQWMAGRIGITRLYSAALTSGQVLQNYNANRATYGV